MYRDSDRPNAHRHPDNQGDWAGQPRAVLRDLFHAIPFEGSIPEIDKLPLLSSTKQILSVAQRVISEIAQSEGISENKAHANKIWSFKEMLSWKIPEDLSSTNVNLSRTRVEAEYLPPPICLYKFNLVTQRIKEQKTNFVGIVTHVKQGVSESFIFTHSNLELGK